MGIKHIAIDTMIIVYILEHHKQEEKCFQILEKATTIIASYLLRGEVLTGYKQRGAQDRADQVKNLGLIIPGFEWKSFGGKTSEIFSDLRSKYPAIKAPDCIHLATAIEHKAETFITNDKQLKQVKEIPITLLG